MSERRLNYNIVKGWADPAKFKKSMEEWWPIHGEPIRAVKIPSKRKLKSLDKLFKSFKNLNTK